MGSVGEEWSAVEVHGAYWRLQEGGLTDLFRSELEALEAKIGTVLMGSSFGSCGIMERAPVLVMVWNAGDHGWETEAQSVAAAIQNMLLKAHGLGLGSLWIGDIYYTKETLERHLRKPWKLMAAVTLGWPESYPEPASKEARRRGLRLPRLATGTHPKTFLICSI